jgi:hypothetical protein
VFAFAIPVELHFDSPAFVGVEFLTFRAGDNCRLYAWHKRLWSQVRESELICGASIPLI